MMRKTGIAIILLGLVLTVFSMITFFSGQKAVTLGEDKIIGLKERLLNISPAVGIAIMGIGGIVFWQTYNTQ